MNSQIILGRLLQKFVDKKVSQYQEYNSFGFVALTSLSVVVARENGVDTIIPFNKLTTSIEAYQMI